MIDSTAQLPWAKFIGREPQPFDYEPFSSLLDGRVGFVTGAAGSIGSELVIGLARLGARQIIAFDHSERGVFDLEQACRRAGVSNRVECVLGDVRDRQALTQAMAAARPAFVFHAAAIKHVPIAERFPVQAAWTNVLGAHYAADAAKACGAAAFILISTDKAADPCGVLGATKAMAETVVARNDVRNGPRFLSVRFANVIGSHGSVGPIFVRQIMSGQALTLTERTATRYFITVTEAVSFILEIVRKGLAQEIGQGRVCAWQLPQPLSMWDFAQSLIAHFAPSVDNYPIDEIGLRPGEKLRELFVGPDEHVTRDEHGVMHITKPPLSEQKLAQILQGLETAVAAGDGRSCRALLTQTIDLQAAAE